MIVFNTTGPSAFTDDPNRHHILEPAASITPSSMVPYMLPGRDITIVLVESYFVNVRFKMPPLSLVSYLTRRRPVL